VSKGYAKRGGALRTVKQGEARGAESELQTKDKRTEEHTDG